ncbi:unnamed protein product [Cyprideis torosa]|uniref:Uncharacterized protein n=1 Tax=Cyprideis torosa TaxID=163714 RepID=A0A7R8WL01_9CRUS|nr:unnamed protein product [Cyprideis torosa]CAG0897513.1 unnamed protein product [Cyprideis torosa]
MCNVYSRNYNLLVNDDAGKCSSTSHLRLGRTSRRLLGTCRNSCDLNTQATGRSLTQQRSDEEDGVLMAATSVFVVEPGDEIYLASAGGLSCSRRRRYALNGRPRSHHSSGGHPAPAYGSGASTMNSSRSYSTTNSDHYAIVHSRPGSRPESRYSQKRHRSGPSMNGGHHHHSDYGNRAGHEVY